MRGVSWSSRLAIVALCVIVLLLAGLQWRWLYVIENWEHVRRINTLRFSTVAFKAAFDRELSSLRDGFEGLPPERAELERALALRLARWQARSRWPEILGAVYRIEPSDGPSNGDALERFDPATEELVPARWPEPLAALRDRELDPPDTSELAPIASVVHPSVPAIELPLRRSADPPTGSVTSVVLLLDEVALASSFLPDLTELMFSLRDFPSIDLAVLASDSGRVLYSTRPIEGVDDFGRVDESRGLLDAGTDGLEMPYRAARRPIGREALPNATRDPTPDENAWFRDLWAHSAYSGHWQVLVRRSAATIADEVDASQRRQLAVGFGLLTLLCSCLALILVVARRAEVLARRQMEFVAGVSHELRTPLAVLAAAGDNLVDSLVDDQDQLRRYGELIQDETLRLREMVENVLHLARRGSSAAPLELRPLEVRSLVEETLERARRLLHEEDFEVETRIASGPLRVLGNARALQSVLMNLISNALKYARTARWLSIAVATTSKAGNEEVVISVEDRGPGLAESERSQVFEPFYRSASAREQQIEGSGLGLAVVRDLVRAHRGRVTVDAAAAGGCVFRVHLPRLVEGSR